MFKENMKDEKMDRQYRKNGFDTTLIHPKLNHSSGLVKDVNSDDLNEN